MRNLLNRSASGSLSNVENDSLQSFPLDFEKGHCKAEIKTVADELQSVRICLSRSTETGDDFVSVKIPLSQKRDDDVTAGIT